MAEEDSAPILAFGAWLGMQLAAIGLASSRVMLSSRYPRAGEQWAMVVLLITQTGVISLIFPTLLISPRWTVLAILALWPMGEIAAGLADLPLARFFASEAFVSVWIVSLYFFSHVLTNSFARLCASAIACMLCWGGPLLLYLHAEFIGTSTSIDWQRAGLLGPTMGVLAQVLSSQSHSAWGLLAFLFVTSLSAAFLAHSASRKINKISENLS